ncbi:hypothetical protein L249_7321 [Ophiocordyceps polyrhachis-furcata BCC 54312]|uniref:aromatic-amino-acid transaminase n=1 Tax=Ophiocordyceps polyrhachis-furcata BCC 54312 TaxID=1330021 RepID=A0A367L9I4_9HYPO|nr:hypothetical protein L249_7321 [Ophiocordyceps polyrhachis-furcata BCC 54312]
MLTVIRAAGRHPRLRLSAAGCLLRRWSHDDVSSARDSLSNAEAAPTASPARLERQQTSSALDDVLARRVRAGRLVAGVAAASHSDMFKGPQNGKPKARRWGEHLTRESLDRQPCSLKQAAKFLKKPGLVSLGGGLPSSELFPFAELAVRVPVAPGFSEKETLENGQTMTIGKYDARDRGAAYDLSIALNYGQSTGSAQMMRFLTEHTEVVCNPPYADWRICQTIGSTGALEQALRMFCDQDRGDSVLTEEFSFSTALETIAPLGVKAFGCAVDDEGLVPHSMDRLLSNWDQAVRGARKPHLLYTVPCGQNPTGATQGAQRRQDIYRIAQKHDMFILEDDPYYFLQMQPYTGRDSADVRAPRSVDEFLSSLLPSLVSIDVDGRVMRLESLSKVLVPGSRLGWVVASEQLIERYQRHAEVASQGPAGFSQVILHKLLDETWGHEGYFRWLMNLRLEYTKKRNALLAACEDHLPREIVSWNPPSAGMFMWLKVDYDKHPNAGTRSIDEIEEDIFRACIDGNVLVARGSWFKTDKDKPLPGLHFRTTFAASSPEAMNEAIRRFAKAVRDSFCMSPT